MHWYSLYNPVNPRLWMTESAGVSPFPLSLDILGTSDNDETDIYRARYQTETALCSDPKTPISTSPRIKPHDVLTPTHPSTRHRKEKHVSSKKKKRPESFPLLQSLFIYGNLQILVLTTLAQACYSLSSVKVVHHQIHLWCMYSNDTTGACISFL